MQIFVAKNYFVTAQKVVYKRCFNSILFFLDILLSHVPQCTSYYSFYILHSSLYPSLALFLNFYLYFYSCLSIIPHSITFHPSFYNLSSLIQ